MAAPDSSEPTPRAGDPNKPTPAGADPSTRKPHSRWRAPLLLIGKIALVTFGAYLVVEAVRAVDWRSVGDAMARLNFVEIIVIALLVMVRQVVNASTLPVLVPKLSMPHAISTAFSGTLIQT